MRIKGKSQNVSVPDWQFPVSIGAHRRLGLVGPTPLPEQVNVFTTPIRAPKKPAHIPVQNSDAPPELVIRGQAQRTNQLRKYMQEKKDWDRHMAIVDLWLERNGYTLRSKDLYSGVK